MGLHTKWAYIRGNTVSGIQIKRFTYKYITLKVNHLGISTKTLIINEQFLYSMDDYYIKSFSGGVSSTMISGTPLNKQIIFFMYI